MEEAEATKGRDGEAEDTIGRDRRGNRTKSGEKAEEPEEKSREAQRRGEDGMQKDTYVTQPSPR